MKNRVLLLLLIIPVVFGLSFLIPTKVKKWTYSLPNHYVVGRISNEEVIIGKFVNNKLTAKDKDKIIGISEYVEAFAYNNQYIYARTLNNDNGLNVGYYIIDSSLEEVYGSYELEGFLDKLMELELDTEINWIQSASYDK